MKKTDILLQLSFAILLLIFAVTGCKETGDLFIDPVEYDIPFTFTPSHGAPGSTVMIQGDNLSGVTQVGFGSIAGEIVSQSSSSISAVVPVGALTSKIKLVKDGVVITSRTNFIVDPSPIPTIIAFDPAVASSGEIITITGNLLDQVDSVFIGSLKAGIEGTPTATELQIVAPVGLQTANIRLFYTYLTGYGMLKPAESVSDMVLSLALPVIESITPSISSLDIGDEVIIAGTMLDVVTKVEFGSVEATPFTYSDGTITCTVPEGATTGTIKLTVPDGFVESSTFQVNLPVISLFLPQKGDEGLPEDSRSFVIDGSNFDLVDSVMIGSVKADILTRTDSKLLLSVPANMAGFVSLYTDNGMVQSTIPFIFTGEFWVNDWETVFSVDRYSHIQNNGFGGFVLDETGTYARISADGDINNKSIYLWGPAAVNDKFTLFTPNPEGVYLEFDLNIMAVPDSLKQPDGTIKFKIFAMDALGWDASGEYSYGYNGPTSYVMADGDWHHVSLHLKDFKASNNSGLYTADQVTSIAGAYCHPNSLRILAFVFGTANSSGKGTMTYGLDNVKFVIN